MFHVIDAPPRGEGVEYGALRELAVPEITVPIPHFSVVDLVSHALGYYDHQVTEPHFGITPDGARFFGVLCPKSEYTGYTDTVGLRNSHEKRFPVGMSFGSKVFVCDNLAFVGDHVIKRKHTANLKRDLPGLIGEIVEPSRSSGKGRSDSSITTSASP